jgi:hypothetical protein
MSSPGMRVSGTTLGAIVAVITLAAASALLFLLIWFVEPGDDHFIALATIGILSLFFALGSTIGRAFTRGDYALKALAWGYVGLGFALLIGSLVLAGSMSFIGLLFEIVGLLLVVLLMGIVAALAVWGAGSVVATQRREMRREAWKATTPASAFDYTTARPSIPSSAPGPTDVDSSTPPPGVHQ